MNIFLLHKNPTINAQMICDKHLPKMIVETGQLLSTTCHYYKIHNNALYKPTHVNHPCAVWARNSTPNYRWLLSYFEELSLEFAYRRSKKHATWNRLHSVVHLALPVMPFGVGVDEFPQCMPDEYKVPGDPVQAYRNYYLNEKAHFAKWEWGRPAPDWWEVL